MKRKRSDGILAECIPERKPCKLAMRLHKNVVSGSMPAYLAQELASDAIDGGSTPTIDLLFLKKLGGEGKRPAHCWGELWKKLSSPFADESMASIEIPLKRGGYGTLEIVLPHALFSSMYHTNKAMFASIMYCGREDNIGIFWESQQDHPAFHGHCMHYHPHRDFRSYGIAFALHADEVATVGCGKAWAKMSHCVSIRSLLANGEIKEVMQIIFQVYACLCKGPYGQETLDGGWRRVL